MPLATSPSRLPEPLHITIRGVGNAAVKHPAVGADGAQGVDAVGGEVQKGADEIGGAIVRLVNRGVDAGPLERHGDNRPANPAADDHGVTRR